MNKVNFICIMTSFVIAVNMSSCDLSVLDDERTYTLEKNVYVFNPKEVPSRIRLSKESVKSNSGGFATKLDDAIHLSGSDLYSIALQAYAMELHHTQGSLRYAGGDTADCEVPIRLKHTSYKWVYFDITQPSKRYNFWVNIDVIKGEVTTEWTETINPPPDKPPKVAISPIDLDNALQLTYQYALSTPDLSSMINNDKCLYDAWVDYGRPDVWEIYVETSRTEKIMLEVNVESNNVTRTE